MDDITGTKKKQEKLDAEATRKRQHEVNDLKSVLKLPEGRRLIWWLLSETKMFSSCFSNNSMMTAWNEGRRDLGIELYGRVNAADINVFGKMQGEYISSKIEEKARQEAAPK